VEKCGKVKKSTRIYNKGMKNQGSAIQFAKYHMNRTIEY